MKKITIPIALLSLSLLINWTSQPEKKGAQFFGTLETRQGKTYRVNQIRFGDDPNTKKSISVYEKPVQPDAFTVTDTNPNHITLNVDPKSAAINFDVAANLQCKNITILSIPKPRETWNYKKEKGYREYTYIEITITTQNPLNPDDLSTTNSYLIDQEVLLHCNHISDTPHTAPETMTFKLPAIKSLTIEGYIVEQPAQPETCPNRQIPAQRISPETVTESQQCNTQSSNTASHSDNNNTINTTSPHTETKTTNTATKSSTQNTSMEQEQTETAQTTSTDTPDISSQDTTTDTAPDTTTSTNSSSPQALRNAITHKNKPLMLTQAQQKKLPKIHQ